MKLITRIQSTLGTLMAPNMEKILRPQPQQPEQANDVVTFWR